MNKEFHSIPVDMHNVSIANSFIGNFQDTVRNVMLPYQWDVLNDRIPDIEKSNSIQNFRIAAGKEAGIFYGEVFQDTDLAKWLEGASYSLSTHPDSTLEKKIDDIIDLIDLAQEKDGYLNTFFSINCIDKKWSNLYECHELYTAGHMIEASVAYYKATGKDRLLRIMQRCADNIVDTFGNDSEKIHGYPGHQEIELALVKLYEVTGDDRYLEQSKYFLDKRGEEPNYFISEWKTSRNRCTFKTNTPVEIPNLLYNQSHRKVRDQSVAVGHSVRAMYMYSAMADIARLANDEEMFNACKALWTNVIYRQMYITGAVGSTHVGEAFTFDYDLPNEIAYAETCASIGLAFFAHRMLKIDLSNEYGDTIERVLYNIIPASVSENGKSFLYVNPLEIWPEASEKNPDRAHVKPSRQPWYGCACCPPNVVRFISSIGEYIYSVSDDVLYIHQYIPGKAEYETHHGMVVVRQVGNYPWDNKISIEIESQSPTGLQVALRIPGWCKKYKITVGKAELQSQTNHGYAFVICQNEKTEISIEFEMEPFFVYANPKVRSDNGKVALQKGPVVYCLEEEDNGKNLNLLRVNTDIKPLCRNAHTESDFHQELICSGFRTLCNSEELYSGTKNPELETEIVAVPYYYWGNRGYGEMQVWSRY